MVKSNFIGGLRGRLCFYCGMSLLQRCELLAVAYGTVCRAVYAWLPLDNYIKIKFQ